MAKDGCGYEHPIEKLIKNPPPPPPPKGGKGK